MSVATRDLLFWVPCFGKQAGGGCPGLMGGPWSWLHVHGVNLHNSVNGNSEYIIDLRAGAGKLVCVVVSCTGSEGLKLGEGAKSGGGVAHISSSQNSIRPLDFSSHFTDEKAEVQGNWSFHSQRSLHV